MPERVSSESEVAAVIATRQEDGKLCVTAIAWDAIATMQLSNVEKLPKELFDDA